MVDFLDEVNSVISYVFFQTSLFLFYSTSFFLCALVLKNPPNHNPHFELFYPIITL